ncbi:unnamed protein product [Fusarium graminearum]|uniref:Uncharacterized protein n=2 Tax=Fusarium sambucinum species complex TaxID=569360 RepID=A0A4U9F5F0_GIBZA|nr:hypothetical protein FAUST_2490 [Fusarium austroamericanum]KAI6761525.1 hypothetical protein HG531_002078 [Fusarium graminearum]CAF3448865.1 unnamed protein product [Fusarium graminearum]CAF3582523.1 unnamed protein product [Fusarium graminearum]CAG1967948.1 unnamed protein product [Fusarium graminearum]
MDSPLPPQEDGEDHQSKDGFKIPDSQEANMNNMQRHSHAKSRTPEPQVDRQASNSDPPDTPGVLEPFDWDEFEARYEAALHDADDQEREILKEADALAKYFKVWAAAASAHDDERAAKRLQTRRRFVNLAEDKMERKQQHYDQVDDLFAFHEAHFSQAALASFGSDFIEAPSQDHSQDDATVDAWDGEDDGLGYYPDGVKRTLTDEQIEIFRHSELEALRKEKEKAEQLKRKAGTMTGELVDSSDDIAAPAQTASVLPTSFHSNKKRKKKKGAKRPEPKPDLRKRTWDVVDKGLDSLEYD